MWIKRFKTKTDKVESKSNSSNQANNDLEIEIPLEAEVVLNNPEQVKKQKERISTELLESEDEYVQRLFVTVRVRSFTTMLDYRKCTFVTRLT